MIGQSTEGSCLCGSVRYEINNNLGIFQYCHCSRCRKITGSAHASNMIIDMSQFQWLSGESFVGRYAPEDTKYFTSAFCTQCGSNLPWQPKGVDSIIIPAGTLDEHPGIEPDKSIFCASRAEWYIPTNELPQHDAMPER